MAKARKEERIDVLVQDMARNPHQWRMDSFRLMHRNGVKIWIGNGLFGYHVEKPHYYEPNLREKWRLHKAIKALQEHIDLYKTGKQSKRKKKSKRGDAEA
jgi:hypothetical protein